MQKSERRIPQRSRQRYIENNLRRTANNRQKNLFSEEFIQYTGSSTKSVSMENLRQALINFQRESSSSSSSSPPLSSSSSVPFPSSLPSTSTSDSFRRREVGEVGLRIRETSRPEGEFETFCALSCRAAASAVRFCLERLCRFNSSGIMQQPSEHPSWTNFASQSYARANLMKLATG